MSTHGWAETRRESEAEVMDDLKLLGVQDPLFVKAAVFPARSLNC